MKRFYLIALSLLLNSPVISSAGDPFTDSVAPILARRCLSCHNEENPQAQLSLREAGNLVDEGYVDPGDSENSYLMELITAHNGRAQMPKDADPLSEAEVTLIARWIDAGAKLPVGFQIVDQPTNDFDWWSLQPIDFKRPGGERKQTSGNVIDQFVSAKLEEQGISPVESADAVTLIRRVTYDLTGLPPTPHEVATFADAFHRSPESAWLALVDRLLHSPAFGEKWGQHWLDLARYAETHGYDKDKPREHAWPYRDYVIGSFNSDKPYSRFVQEQIAGDALGGDNPDAVIALGFLAAGPWDFIGHWEVGEAKLDGRIAKHLDRDEMVAAVFNVFQSTTVQCAQCHHHKFDPISMEDYYRLHAVFAAIDRADRVYEGLSPAQQQAKAALIARINELKQQQETLTTQVNRIVAAKASGIDRRIAALKEKHGTGSTRHPQYGYHSRIAKQSDQEKWVQIDLGKSRSVAVIRVIPAYDDFAGIGAGFGFPVRYRVEVANDADLQSGVRVLLDATEQDEPNPKTSSIMIRGDGKPFRYLRLVATKLAQRRNDFILALAEIEALSADGTENVALHGQVTAMDSIESGVRWAKSNLVDGLYDRELADEGALAELQELQSRRTQIENKFRPADADEQLAMIAAELKSLQDKLNAFPQGALVYAATTEFARGGRFTATGGKPRPIHLLHRGDLRSPGDLMTPGAPPLWEQARESFIDHTHWDEREARVQLAHYVTDRNNPLVWRSIVNRLWGWTFGVPLVATANDFGRGGVEPTHPELLDFLATRLRDDPNQSLKSIIRLLVTSQTYRRTSQSDPRAAAVDGDNQFLWRANRRRLTAEEFRDTLLANAGVLDRRLGGPSFKDFVIEKPQHSPHYEYHLHDPADTRSHRRTIYRFVVRSQPQPLLTTLDCADPSISVPRRDESTTALQALGAWNNRLVAFAAGEFGNRIGQHSTSLQEQVQFACRQTLARQPSTGELETLSQCLGDHGPANVARVIFNLNAFQYLD